MAVGRNYFCILNFPKFQSFKQAYVIIKSFADFYLPQYTKLLLAQAYGRQDTLCA